LKQALFTRNGRGIVLTQAGNLLLTHARKIIEQVEEAQQALESSRKEVVGSVAIAAASVTKEVLTRDFVSAFRSRFPKASLEIIEGKSRTIQEWVLGGRVDIGIVHGPAIRPAIEIIPLAAHELYLVSRVRRAPAPTGAAVPFKDISSLPLILPSVPHAIRNLVEAQASRLKVSLNIVLQVDGAQFIVDLVQRGHGYAILPAFSLTMRNLSDKLQLNEIVQPRLTRALNIAIATQRPLSRVARESIKLIRQHLGALPARD
jgi:LysR family nitrogen assimilation transcriptional regulator